MSTPESRRFVILTHDHPFLHWDLMLEQGEGGALRTWRLRAEPAPETIIVAEPLPDHRRHYLDYEGPVSGGRGQVARWDTGTYHPEDISEDRVVVSVDSERLVGSIILTACSNAENWTFLYHPEA